MVYILVFLIILFYSFSYDYRNKNIPNGIVFFIALLFVLIAGFRYRVGTDTLVYMDEYESSDSLSQIKDKYLIGWYLFMKMCHSLHLNFYAVQFIIAIIINYGVIRYIKTTIPQAVFSGLLVYFVLLYPGWNFELLRQAICISLFLLAIPYTEKGKYLHYYAIIAVACTIHETALLLLLVPPLFKIKITRKSLLVISVFIVVLLIVAPLVRERIYYYALLLQPFQDKAAMYFEQADTGGSFSIWDYLVNMILNVFIPLWAVFYNLKNKRFSNTFVILVLLSAITYIISTMLPMLYRIYYYYYLFYLIIIIDLIKEFSIRLDKKNYRLLFFIILLSFIAFKSRVYFSEWNGVPNYVHYYPYTNITNEYRVPDREWVDRGF